MSERLPFQKTKLFFFVFLGLIVIVILLQIVDNTTQDRNQPKNLTLSKGKIQIPGFAYLDGRDLEAATPVTISKINIWNSYNRTKVLFSLSHGDYVKVLSTQYVAEEGRYYLKIKSENCEGWVSEPFISAKKMEPIGELFTPTLEH
ncbi:MAG: hypothetical protein U5K00_24040 [Melioribacteraceae bacterium]|nr:hypothetical protein [Melioribacteraceae bacterium]